MASVQSLRAANPEQSTEEAEIRQAIDSFLKAFRAKDLDAIVSCYAPGVIAFDMMPPLRHSGIQSWRRVWAESLPMMDGAIDAEIRDLTVDVASSGDLALCHGVNHFVMRGGKENVDLWFRWTAGFRKINGKWLVTHEHNSVPVDMESGKARTDLIP